MSKLDAMGWKSMQALLLLVLTLVTYLQSEAQEYTQTIKGTVTNAETKVPVIGANVVILGSDPMVGAVTDEQGNFRIQHIRIGRRTLKITSIGYIDFQLNDLMVTSGKEIILDISLYEKVYEGKEIVVKGNKSKESSVNSMNLISSRRFSVEESNRYAGGFNDLSRMATAFAGVASFNGETNEIVIRGNSPRGLLWRVEGIEISNPNHFPRGDGASGGGISIITSDVITDSDFLTGAFGSEYGNALSGVFDINLRKGNQEKYEYSFKLGAIGIEAMAEGPVSKRQKGSFLINYRYSTLALLETAGFHLVDNTVIPTFHDLTFTLSLPTKKAGSFMIFGLGGNSQAGEKAIRDSLHWDLNRDRIDESEVHLTGAMGVKHIFLFKNQKTYLRSTLLLNAEQNSSFSDSLDNRYAPITIYKEGIEYTTFRSSINLNHKLNAKNTFRTGITYSLMGFKISAGNLNHHPNTFNYFISDSGSANLIQTYFQWKNNPIENIELIGGFHSMYFLLTHEATLEPRFALRWKFAGDQSVNYGAGLHSRIEPLSMYYSGITNADGQFVQPNLHLRMTKALHQVLGYDICWNSYHRFKTEVYFQYLFDVPIDASGQTTFSTLNYKGGIEIYPLTNKGIGYNYGLELTLERFHFHGIYYLVTVSLFDSKYRAADNHFYNTLYNSHFIINTLIGKEFQLGKKGNKTLGVNSRLYYKGGNRVTPIDIDSSILEGRAVYIYSRTFAEKTTDFIRWDAGINLNVNLKSWAWHFSLDLQNVLNRKNIYTEYYDPETRTLKYLYSLPLIPVFNFKVDF
jgi:hypothetical protein